MLLVTIKLGQVLPQHTSRPCMWTVWMAIDKPTIECYCIAVVSNTEYQS
ncbi:MAG: hypothetical protein AAGU14_04250 [Eubacteriaceae bacterium]